MTAALILPGRFSPRAGRFANGLLVWRANDFDVVPLTGQPATFTRAATRSGTDPNGVSYTAVAHQPAWSMVDTNADAVRDRVALDMGTSDKLAWATGLAGFRLSALQELSVYVELDPAWARTGGVAGDPGILTIGGTQAFAGDGRAVFDLRRASGGALLTARLALGTTQLEASVAVPASGLIAILAQLQTNATLHRVHIETAAASADSAYSAAMAGALWRSDTVTLNARSNGETLGQSRYFRVAIARGRRTLADMAGLAT